MKKIFYVMVAAFALTFVSCGSQTPKDAEASNDSIEVLNDSIEVVNDSIEVVDTLTADSVCLD